MKTLFFSLALLIACTTVSAQFTKAELQVAGLTCSMCSKATDKQLRTLDFIEDIDIDLSHASFILHFRKGKAVDISQIKKKVEDAGFSVAMLKPVYNFDNLKIEEGSSFSYQNMVFYFVNAKTQTLNGDIIFKIIDKGFVPDKEYKKLEKELKESEGQVKNAESAGSHVYHITL